jgi:hypothetical protein
MLRGQVRLWTSGRGGVERRLERVCLIVRLDPRAHPFLRDLALEGLQHGGRDDTLPPERGFGQKTLERFLAELLPLVLAEQAHESGHLDLHGLPLGILLRLGLPLEQAFFGHLDPALMAGRARRLGPRVADGADQLVAPYRPGA